VDEEDAEEGLEEKECSGEEEGMEEGGDHEDGDEGDEDYEEAVDLNVMVNYILYWLWIF